jgi:hypothetical protein
VLKSETFRDVCIRKCLDYNAMQCMKQFPGSAVVQSQGLRLVGTLAFGNDKVRRRTGEEGVMSLVVTAMRGHRRDEAVALHSLTAITNLTHRSLENKMRYASTLTVNCGNKLKDVHSFM